jgi:hypothetical protein
MPEASSRSSLSISRFIAGPGASVQRPPDFWGKYFLIGLVPQLVFWVAYTLVLGSLCGGIAVAIKGRGKFAVPAA